MFSGGIVTLTILSISLLINLFFIEYLRKTKKNNKFMKDFVWMFILLSIYVVGLIAQILCKNTIIKPVYFEYITYFGAIYMTFFLFRVALNFKDSQKKRKYINLLLIVPTISMLILWTNDLHQLFFKVYSTNIEQVQYGPYFTIHSLYTYGVLIVSMIILINTSIHKSGFFSKQTGLIVLGSAIPVAINILGTLKIIPMTVYMTPITFIATAICFSLAIVKYKALNITPIAFRTVIDTMSDAYIVISDDGTVVDTNKTFRSVFNSILKANTDDNFYEMIEQRQLLDVKQLKETVIDSRRKDGIITKEYHMIAKGFDRYFEVDVHPIKARKNVREYVGTLLLFKDITQHKIDIKEIEEKQDIIVKQQQLVSIGELAGGVAHDINTPISAIKTGILMMTQMGSAKTEEEKQILQRMDNCATKIITIVNSMRNQIRNLGSDTNIKFKISDVVNDIKIITYHEIKKNNSELITQIEDDLSIVGDPTKLGQVLTNLVVNAAQAYNNEGGKIEVTVVQTPDKQALIKVADYAGGLDPSIAPFIFKNILTTKGTNGTGLGLYLAYSVIKGNFNGDITFDTEKGKGTIFYIKIPKA